MSNIEGIFSIRIVVADYYMHSPKLGLDQCYSEFQSNQIKSVPTIRIFGANSDGHKTCMHIHGVFPYFYIPYESSDFGSIDKFIYQISSGLDKAINISLGQASSKSQHIFKVQLVKGIPFYGYHKTDHQFLKIFLYNPKFIKRAANVLQNGAILGKIFQPHESHVPYILQFLIDYNLYGMSFLHVPKEIVKYRKNENEDILFEVNAEQILRNDIEKQSISELEIDISAAFILNRFQLLTSESQHKNPGIESIWQDEKLRRAKLSEQVNDNIPSLEIPLTQDRLNAKPTESNIFYLNGLQNKLEILKNNSEILNESINLTLLENQSVQNLTISNSIKSNLHNKRTFNLNKILNNSVYPEECTQNNIIMNASIVHDHLSSLQRNILVLNDNEKTKFLENKGENDMVENSLVNEEIVLSLSQPQNKILNLSLRDFEALEVMRQLEEGNDEQNCQYDLTQKSKIDSTKIGIMEQIEENIDAGIEIDLDSTLAPLEKIENVNQFETIENSIFLGEEEDNINDYTLSMDDIDKILKEIEPEVVTSDTDTIPQLDGATKEITPKKSKVLKLQHRSPKTPKKNVSERYAPLKVIVKSPKSNKNGKRCRTSNNNNLDVISVSSSNESESSPSNVIYGIKRRKSIRKANQICHNSCVGDKKDEEIISISSTDNLESKELLNNCNLQVNGCNGDGKKKRKMGRLKSLKNLDKTTLITCNLKTPKSSDKILKFYNINKNNIKNNSPNLSHIKPCVVKLKREKKMLSVNSVRNNGNQVDEKVPELSTVTPSIFEIKNGTNILSSSSVGNDVNQLFNVNEINSNENFENSKIQLVNNLSPIKKCKIMIKKCDFGKLSTKLKKVCYSPSDVAREFDRRNNFFPEPGPSTVNYYELIQLPVHTPSKYISSTIEPENNINEANNHSLLEKNNENFIDLTPNTDIEDDTNIKQSMIESFYLNSPSLFSDIDSPINIRPLSSLCSQNEKKKINISDSQKIQSFNKNYTNKSNIVLITPEELPPNHNNVLENLPKFQIPEYSYTQPFYSNSSDVINNRKEIGHTTLIIPGNSLNDCQDFLSLVPNLIGINKRRKKMLESLFELNELHNIKTYNEIKEYFCVEKQCVVSSRYLPPTKYESKVWIKARELIKTNKNYTHTVIENNKDEISIEDDSPIKIRRQKVVMMLENNSDDQNSSDDMDNSLKSLSMSPMTPPTKNEFITQTNEKNTTPRLNKSQNKISRTSAKLSLSKKLNSIKVDKIKCIPGQLLIDTTEKKLPERFIPSKSNDSVSSEAILAELEKSSFKKNLDSFSADHDKSFGLSSATLDNTFGFRVNLECLRNAKFDIEYNYLTIMSLEVFVPTRYDLKPNPEFDQIECLFYSIVNNVPDNHRLPTNHHGCIIVQEVVNSKLNGIEGNIIIVKSELELFDELANLCRIWDPDIFAGYEIEMNSWGYVIDRAKNVGLQFVQTLSRIPSQKIRETITKEDNEQYTDLDFELKLCGRILLDVWRLMRSEIALTSYTFENVMYHIMHRRCPAHSFRSLTEWYSKSQSKWIVFEYYMERVDGTLAILNQLDLIGRTSEIAKLIGIQFYEVLSRGSQYRVESMMLRIAKPKNLIPLSPSVDQRAHMRAPEYLPLILEPKSRFYADPLIVLDFQSLYPSMIIAYNYCFSTCLGRIEHLGDSASPFEFGASQLRVSPVLLKKLIEKDQVTISPCGVVFVKSDVREGILKRMLSEILNTRLMVKQSMKIHKTNSILQRVLHSRQLGLKLMANVTYGYTAANFSGRMPCVEVADSVVAKGRETLERAIKMVETNDKWRAKVVYGDTDSLFVLCEGRSRADAFKIGEEIALAVTEDNPQPVKLKLEKVYQPCILQTKKRYVGYMYESVDQNNPVYEAKGIETVRRDGCPAVTKILEKTLKILFETKDVSKIKEYVCRQFTKILQGKANIQDLIYAKEFRGINGYKPTACVPALEMTRKWIQLDPRNIPRTGERVPYIITNGPPGVPLIRLVRSPHEVLSDEGLKINSIYYITKAIIPPLNRCLLLIGVDINEWFVELPRKITSLASFSADTECIKNNHNFKKSTISQYFSSTNCIIDCGRQTKTGICTNCLIDSTKCVVTLKNKISKLERNFQLVQKICQSCCGRFENIKCNSLDCPVLYILENKKREQKSIQYFQNILEKYF